MLPINSISIENFKSFGPKQRVPLSRINFLFGPNSHGKSSVLTALGYLMNGLFKRNPQLKEIKFLDSTSGLRLDGRLVNHFAKNEYFELEFEFMHELGFGTTDKSTKLPIRVALKVDDDYVREISAFEINSNELIPALKINELYVEIYTDSAFVKDYMTMGGRDDSVNFTTGGVLKGDQYGVKYNPQKMMVDQRYAKDIFNRDKRKYAELVNNLIELLFHKYQIIFEEAEIRQVKEYGLDWLGSSRTVPGRPLTVEGEKTFFEDSFLNKKAIADLNEWLSDTDTIDLDYEFLFNESFSSLSGQKLKEFGLRLRSGGDFIPFNHVGSGVSHIFQILLPFFNGSEVLVIQQPEIHLHPSLQVQLMRACVELSKLKNVQLIFETHSEHFIKAAQLEIASGLNQMKPVFENEDLSVLYISKDENGFSKVKQMEIDDTGAFTEPWPDDFFELSADLTMERLRNSFKARN